MPIHYLPLALVHDSLPPWAAGKIWAMSTCENVEVFKSLTPLPETQHLTKESLRR